MNSARIFSHFRNHSRSFLTAAFIAAFGTVQLIAQTAQPDTATVMRRVFDWQVAHPWSTQHPVDHRWGTRGWVHGAFLTGVMEAFRATNDPAYLDFSRVTSEKNSWQPGSRPRHADDHIVSQTYLELNALAPSAPQIAPTRAVIDKLIAEKPAGRELWHWCDALYMAPPTFAKLTQATGDPRYLDEMDRLYWDVYDALYDPAEKLFYRDKNFLKPREGKKIFWSRGNGWVLAGLARLLDAMPSDHISRPRYVALFRDMSARLLALQPTDGLWRADLLHPAGPHGEVSGSAFFCYAFAWGINQGILPAAEYRPAVDRTWSALLACVDADGKLGWVQPIGYAPGAYDATTSQEYGAGAFLAAGSQMLKLP
ncbi:family 88 glycosyl hydrolase [Nibricoccus aquaticus]|uniref:Family 88 glycosyl hydrolase n=1 Tax=Nibricoccus aquaticus TaxID=2576891 RepID=A0A290QGS5_9BACT|nr:glycoside hydrolase family 88 protein [Nibricoccus aquaticus]ATC63551.1 family 88 glycosyl hydrolase [Nibricoccus aquaticus]